jgi:hypothetical protein
VEKMKHLLTMTKRAGGIIMYKTKRTEGITQNHEDRLDYTGQRGEIGLQRIMWTLDRQIKQGQ